MWIRLAFIAILFSASATLARASTTAVVGESLATHAASQLVRDVACPPYEPVARPIAHHPPRHRRPRRPRSLVKPTVGVAVRPHAIHHRIKAARFLLPSFLTPPAKPGRCEVKRRGVDAPLLMSALPAIPADDAVAIPAAAPPETVSAPAADVAGASGVQDLGAYDDGPFAGLRFAGAGGGSGSPGPFASVGNSPPGGSAAGPAPPLVRVLGAPPPETPDTASPPDTPGGPLGGPPLVPPDNVAPPVADVPEPDAWALMLVGVAAVGMALRASRRRRSSIRKIE